MKFSRLLVVPLILGCSSPGNVLGLVVGDYRFNVNALRDAITEAWFPLHISWIFLGGRCINTEM